MHEIFNTLNSINVNDHTEKKNGLTYLSWAWAWAEVKKVYPDATYEVKKFEGKPWIHDKNLGYLVMTEMTIGCMTHEMWLPVMDGANKAMKDNVYSYKVKEYKNRQWTGEYTEKEVEQATMFDINTAIMRCLVKNIAMFGLGLYIYAGEDLPPEKDASKSKIDKITKLCKAHDVNQEALYRKYQIYDGKAPNDKQADMIIELLERKLGEK